MTIELIIGMVVALFGGGALATLYKTWLERHKPRAERESIYISAAEGLVILQTGVIERLEANQRALEERFESRLQSCEDRMNIAWQERNILESRNSELEQEKATLDNQLERTQDNYKDGLERIRALERTVDRQQTELDSAKRHIVRLERNTNSS